MVALAAPAAFGWINAGEAENARAVAVTKEVEANQQAEIARAGEIAALAVSQRHQALDRSLLLSVEAWKENQALPRTQNVLLESTQTNLPLTTIYVRASRPGLEYCLQS